MDKKSLKSEKKRPKAPIVQEPSAEELLKAAQEENERLLREVAELKQQKAQHKADSGKVPAGLLKKINYVKKATGNLEKHLKFLSNMNEKAPTYNDQKEIADVEAWLRKELLERWPEVAKYPYVKEEKEKKSKKVKLVIEEDDVEVPANQTHALESSNFFLA